MISLSNVFPFFLLVVVGSFINLPLGKRQMVLVERPYFFGLFKKSYMALQGISINVGGAVIPVLAAFYFLLRTPVPLRETFLAIVFITIVSKIFAKFVPGQGIVLSPFLVAILAVVFAFVVAPHQPAQVAFISGVLGVLFGADVLNIPRILRMGEGGILSIGGAGVFDGIFLIGIISALLAGL